MFRRPKEEQGFLELEIQALQENMEPRIESLSGIPGLESPVPETRRHRLASHLGVFVAGAATVLAVAAVGWGYLNREEPPLSGGPDKELARTDDGVLRVATWNMHREGGKHIKGIKKIMANHDALVMQEVTPKDERKIVKAIKSKYFWTYEVADAKQKPLDGGLGNMIITTRKQRDVTSQRIKGGSMEDTYGKTTTGAVSDLSQGDFSWHDARVGLLENRTILSVTAKAIGGMSVRFITTHIAASPSQVHESQMKIVLKYAEDAKKSGMPVVLCADLNEKNPAKVVVPFSNEEYITREVTKPTTTSGNTIDYCTYYPQDKLGLMRTRVLPQYKTDHMAVEGVVAPASP